jgi:hypothetical protein
VYCRTLFKLYGCFAFEKNLTSKSREFTCNFLTRCPPPRACSRVLLHITASSWVRVVPYRPPFRLLTAWSLFFAAISYSQHSLMYGGRLSKSGILFLKAWRQNIGRTFPVCAFVLQSSWVFTMFNNLKFYYIILKKYLFLFRGKRCVFTPKISYSSLRKLTLH